MRSSLEEVILDWRSRKADWMESEWRGFIAGPRPRKIARSRNVLTVRNCWRGMDVKRLVEKKFF